MRSRKRPLFRAEDGHYYVRATASTFTLGEQDVARIRKD